MIGILRLFLSIVVTHTHLVGNDFGHWAVTLFYVISGYFAAMSLSCSSGIEFLRSKFLRLLPLFWVCSLLTVVIFLLSSADETHYLMGLPDSLNQWFLQLSMLIYKTPALIPQAWCFRVMIFWWVVMALGIGRRKSICLFWLGASTISLIVLGMWPYSTWYLTIWFGSFPFALGATAYHYGIKLPKDNKVCAIAGAMSYPVFLLHFQVGGLMASQWKITFGWNVFWLTSLFTLAVSWLLIIYVERPIARYRAQFHHQR